MGEHVPVTRTVTWLAQHRGPLLLGLAVSVLGFGAMSLLWALRDWPTDRGLFDYYSATVGDGLLLPITVGILASVWLEDRRPTDKAERRWVLGGVALGLAAGVATQVVWLADAEPVPNWSFPRAHHFNLAGWYHATFLVAVSGLLAGLSVAAVIRIRRLARADSAAVDRLAESPWLGVLVGSVASLVGLIVIDNQAAEQTSAGVATTVAVAVSAAIGMTLLALTFGRGVARALPTLAVGLAGAAGLCSIAGFGPNASTLVSAVLVASAVILAVALVEPPAFTGAAAGKAVAIALVFLATATIALELADEHGTLAIVSLAGGAAFMVRLGGVAKRRPGDNFFLILGVFFVCAVPVLAQWLDDRSPSVGEAALAVGAAEGLVELLVIGLVRDRFRDFMTDVQAERAWRPGDPEPPPQPAPGARTWFLIVSFALPALAGMASLYVVAADTLQVDAGSGGSPGGLVGLLVVAAIVTLAGGIAVLLALSRSTPRELPAGKEWLEKQVRIPAAAGVVVAVALLVWGGALVARVHWDELHFPAFAAVTAIVLAAIAAEDLVSSPVRLQLPKMSIGAGLLVALAAAVYALAVFWLVADGLWVEDRPASVGGSLAAAGIVVVATAAICACLAVVLARGLPTPPITESPPEQNGAADQFMYIGLVLFGAAVPAFIVGRVETQQIENAGLVTFAGAGLIVAFIGVYMWVTGLNDAHARFEAKVRPPIEITEASSRDLQSEVDLNDERVSRLARHVKFTNRVSRLLLIGSAIWVAAEIG